MSKEPLSKLPSSAKPKAKTVLPSTTKQALPKASNISVTEHAEKKEVLPKSFSGPVSVKGRALPKPKQVVKQGKMLSLSETPSALVSSGKQEKSTSLPTSSSHRPLPKIPVTPSAQKSIPKNTSDLSLTQPQPKLVSTAENNAAKPIAHPLPKQAVTKKPSAAIISRAKITSPTKDALTTLKEKLSQAHANLADWQQESLHFVPLQGSWQPNATHEFALEEEIHKFLTSDKNNKKVLLLAGNSGAGKSLYTQRLAIQLWQTHTPQAPIPLWISLPALKDPVNRAIEETLTNYGCSVADIGTLKQTQRFIFILDAYDEIRTLKNLFVSNHLEQWQAKVIITCRQEYLYHLDNPKLYFVPFQNEKAQYPAYQEIFVRPFNPQQIQIYIEQYIKTQETSWKSVEQYQQAIAEIPGLKNLITTPFMLKLTLEALPQIMERYQQDPAPLSQKRQLTQAALYDVFIEQWFTRQEQKLKASNHINSEEDIKPKFWAYAKSLSQAMHEAGITQVYYNPSEEESDLFGQETETTNPWKPYFDPANPRIALLSTACLIREVNPHHYAFMHSSLLEYFLTRQLYEHLTLEKSQLSAPVQVTSSTDKPEKIATSGFINQSKKSEQSDYFNQRLLVKEANTLQFLADRVAEQASFKQSLFDRVYASKNNPTMQIAAANAITVLNRARIAFSRMDLSNVKIPNADLSGALLERTNLMHADLTGVNLTSAWLSHTQLQHAHLSGIIFTEKPSILKNSGNGQSLAYSADGRWLVTREDNKVYLWDALTIQLRHILTGGTDEEVWRFRFSPDSRWLAVEVTLVAEAKYKNKIRLWDINKVTCEHILESNNFSQLAFSPNNLWLVGKDREGSKLCFWDVANGQVARLLQIGTRVESFAFSPDGQWLVLGNAKGMVQFRDTLENKLLHEFKAIAGSAYQLIFSPNGQRLVIGNRSHLDKEGCFILFDITQLSQPQLCQTLTGKYVAFSPDGNLLALFGAVPEIKLYEGNTGLLRLILQGRGGVESAAFDPTSKMLAVGSDDALNGVYLWDCSTGQELMHFTDHGSAIDNIWFSLDGKTLISSCHDIIRLHDVTHSQKTLLKERHKDAVYAMIFTQDKSAVKTYSSEGNLFTWSIVDGQVLERQAIPTCDFGDEYFENPISPDGQWLVLPIMPREADDLELWDVAHHKLIQHWPETGTARAFSPSSQYLAFKDEIGNIQVWGLAKNEQVYTLVSPSKAIKKLAFNENNQYLAVMAEDSFYLWEIIIGKENKLLWHIDKAITAIAFSSNSQHLALGGEDKTLQIWDIAHNKISHTLQNEEPIEQLLWSPNNQYLVARSNKQTVLWEYARGVQKHVWPTSFEDMVFVGQSTVLALRASPIELALHTRITLWDVASNQSLGILACPVWVIAWRSFVDIVKDEYYLVIGDRFGGVICWRGAKQVDKTLHWYLYWRSHDNLYAGECNLNQVTGLSPLSLQLLKEREAVGNPLVLAEDHLDWIELHIAAANNNVKQLTHCLQTGLDKESKTTAGETPLHIAASYGSLESVKLLVANGADRWTTTAQGQLPGDLAHKNKYWHLLDYLPYRHEQYPDRTFLQCAIMDKHLLLVEWLLKQTNMLDINAKNEAGNTALLSAIKHLPEVVPLLLQHGANPNIGNAKGKTPLHRAIDKGNIALVKLLLENGADIKAIVKTITKDNATPLHIAVEKGDITAVRLLLDKGAEVNAIAKYYLLEDATPLHLASKKGYVEIVKLLLDSGANIKAVTKEGYTPLHVAAERGKVNVIYLLLRNGAEVNAVTGRVTDTSGTEERKTPLHLATVEGHADAIRVLLENGADIHAITRSGETPLHTAARWGKVEAIRLLLEKGANIDAVMVQPWEEDGQTPLHLAAAEGRIAAMQLLLEKGADSKAVNKRGETPLYAVSKNGNVEGMRLLLMHGADIKAITNEDETVLHSATRGGKIEVLRFLLESGAEINTITKEGRTPLHIAVAESYVKAEVIQLFLEKGADVKAVTRDNETPLHLAAESGKVEAMRLLLDKGADINAVTKQATVNSWEEDGQTPLHLAAARGHLEAVQLLLEKGADIKAVTKIGSTALHVVVRRNQLDEMRLLLSNGAEINAITKEGETPLHLAAAEGRIEAMQLLLERGADLNAVNKNGLPPLHLATQKGKIEVIRLLLENKAEIHRATKGGETPLHIAARIGKIDVIRFLLERGANVNAVIKYAPGNFGVEEGKTPLHVAAAEGYIDAIRLLLERGANIHAVTKAGETPLHVAARKGNVNVIYLLLEKGVDINFGQIAGQTPLHLAIIGGHIEAVKFLLEKGADINIVNNKGENLLHVAALNGKLDVMRLLLEKGVNIHGLTKEGETPLHKAVCGYWEQAREGTGNKQIEAIQVLLEKGANIQAITNNGQTPLHLAAAGGHIEAVKFLLEKGADIYAVNSKGENLLHIAALNGKLNVMRLLLEKGVNIHAVTKDGGETPLHKVVYGCWEQVRSGVGNKQIEAIEMLLAKGANIQAIRNNGQTPLHIAARFGKIEIIRLFLTKGVDVNVVTKSSTTIGGDEDGLTPLHLAATNGYVDAMQLLLEKGADIKAVTKEGNSPLHVAARNGKLTTMQVLLNKGADIHAINNQGETPLHQAVIAGKVDVVKWLLEKGASIHAVTKSDETPLHLAFTRGKAEVVKVFLEKNIDMNSVIKRDLSLLSKAVLLGQLEEVRIQLEKTKDIANTLNEEALLSFAARFGQLNIMRLLLEKGAKVNSFNIDSETPLYCAAGAGKLEAMKLLLEKDADIKAITHKGETPLHAAARNGQLSSVQLLLDKGVDVNVINQEGKTAAQIALEKGYHTIAERINVSAIKNSSISDIKQQPSSMQMSFFGKQPVGIPKGSIQEVQEEPKQKVSNTI